MVSGVMGICKRIPSTQGFTLIELLIVIAIIGILTAIAIPQFSIYRARAYNSAAVSDLKSAAIAQEAYYVENRTYASAEGSLMAPPFSFYTSRGVAFTINAANTTSYNMVAHHFSGTLTYTVTGPGGIIVP